MTYKLKITEAINTINRLFIEHPYSCFCYGGGRESSVILSLLKKINRGMYYPIRIALVENEDGIVYGLVYLLKQLGYKDVKITPGKDASTFISLGKFERINWKIRNIPIKESWINPQVNWVESISTEKFEGAIIGWRLHDRPPRDFIAENLGLYSTSISEPKLTLALPLLNWTSDDLSKYLKINEMVIP